jgi:hypothetical protein
VLLEALTPASTLANEFAKSHGRRVSELMSTHVVSASEDTPVGQIATLLEKHRIKRIPILRDGRLVGIVSRANLIQALASSLPQVATGDSDRKIRVELLDRLNDQDWTDFGSRNIIVNGGVVHLWGLVGSPEEHKLAGRARRRACLASSRFRMRRSRLIDRAVTISGTIRSRLRGGVPRGADASLRRAPRAWPAPCTFQCAPPAPF